MARPKRMGGRIALYLPKVVLDQAAEVVALRAARLSGMEPVVADIYREALIRGLPLVLASERAAVAASGSRPSTGAAPSPTRRSSGSKKR